MRALQSTQVHRPLEDHQWTVCPSFIDCKVTHELQLPSTSSDGLYTHAKQQWSQSRSIRPGLGEIRALAETGMQAGHALPVKHVSADHYGLTAIHISKLRPRGM